LKKIAGKVGGKLMSKAVVAKNIRYNGTDIKVIDNKKFGLLGIKFIDNQANEFIWWPKWDDIRFILLISMFTEWANEGPYKWSEMENFLKDVEGLPNTVAVWVGNELPRVKEQLTKLINQGKFNEVANILTRSDLQKVVDWYARKSKIEIQS
jgi:hypothetical protein